MKQKKGEPRVFSPEIKSRIRMFCRSLTCGGGMLFLFGLASLLTGILLHQLQSGNGTASTSGSGFPGGAEFVSALMQSRECEVPALRSRLGQQLQLNIRSMRSSYQVRIQRLVSSSGFLPPELCMELVSFPGKAERLICKASSYEVYSIFTSPVRAGPQFISA
jgi:hypothetical protein